MRTILGFLVGVIATIGVAYFHDNTVGGPGHNIVNWDQAAEFGRSMVDVVRQQIERLTGK
jgi:hypothetical protein